MKYTQIPVNTFQQLQLNAGYFAKNFDPTDGAVEQDDILGATSGGANITITPSYTDLGEDTLARCHYKMGAASLNRLLARVDSISVPQSREGKERLARIRNIVFDLRQLCLNLAEQSAQTGGKRC